MTQEEIKAYIRDNLSICINRDYEQDYGRSYEIIEVNLLLEGESIAKDTFTIKT